MLVGWRKAIFKLAAYILIIVNIISMVFAILLFSTSVWLIASPTTLILAIQTFGNDYMKVLVTEDSSNLSATVGLAVVSAFLIFIAFMGLYGAVTCSQFLLFMYSTLVMLLLLLECALMFYFSSDIVEKGITEQDGQWVHALRLALNCCEYNSTSENLSSIALPWSCCGIQGHPSNCTASKLFRNDCQQTFTKWLDAYGTSIYVGLTVFHVLLSCCSFARRSCSASYLHT